MNITNALRLATTCIYGSEGFRAVAYLDTLARVPCWTIGHGTTRVNDQPVTPGMTCTRQQAEDWAMADMTATLVHVLNAVRAPLNDNQAAALVSFAYNIGVGAFDRSSVKAALDLGLYQQAADRLLEYDEAGGKRLAGLDTRRARERALFLAQIVITAPPVEDPTSADALNRAELAKLNSSGDHA